MTRERPRGLGPCDLLSVEEAARMARCAREDLEAFADRHALWLISPGKRAIRLIQAGALLEALRAEQAAENEPTTQPSPPPPAPRTKIRRRITGSN